MNDYITVGSASQGIVSSYIEGQERRQQQDQRRQLQQYAAQQNQNQQELFNQQQTMNQQRIQQMDMQLGQVRKQQIQTTVRDALLQLQQGNVAYANEALKDPAVRQMAGVTQFENREGKLYGTVMQPDGTSVTVPIDTNAPDFKLKMIQSGAQAVLDEQKLRDAKAAQAGMITEMYDRFIAENPNASAEEIKAFMSEARKGGSGMKPFDIQTAEWAAQLKTKIDAGTASPEEKAQYDAWLLQKGGTTAANSELVSTQVQNLQQSGVDLNAPDFSLDKLQGSDRVKAETAIRNLEGTQGGKKLVANISNTLAKGLGAVEATSQKLYDLATAQNLKTNVVKETINKVQAYLPTAYTEMDEASLKDAEFRQAFLSSAATFLKIQSGLTVSEKEAQRFASSFGTLSKNEKVNMIGLKTKVDEIIGTYEKYSALEPTLYNAKYAGVVKELQAISAGIEDFVDTKQAPTAAPTPAPTPAEEEPASILKPEDVQSLDSIFKG